MNQKFTNIENIEYETVDLLAQEVQFTDKKRKKQRRRRRNRIFGLLGLVGAAALAVLAAYWGIRIWKQQAETEEAVVSIEGIRYTQEELDARVQAAVEEETALSVQAAQEEILSGIREGLESGVSVAAVLRKYYPRHIVLVSGGRYHFVPVNDRLKKNAYEQSNLNILENGEYQYLQDGQLISYKGIDVSKHQGEIDWQRVAEDGVEFAFIRVALRGYGTGKLVEDERFEENIEGAQAAGIKVGVYLYSQAINEDELLEEANLVLEKIAPYTLECPVVFDVEMVSGGDGRMNALSAEERTTLTALFCKTIAEAGYQPMIYHNMEMGVLKLNLEELEPYDKWFASYSSDFYYPYEYKVWQYSEKGRVNGITGTVDLNISFSPLWEE